MPTTICLQCGGTFPIKPCRLKKGEGKFCSLKCRSQAKITKIQRVCLACGNTFLINPSRIKYGKGKFCSKQCLGVALRIARKGKVKLSGRNRVELRCLTCGVTFTTYPSRIKQKFCSKRCFYKSLEGIEPVEATKQSMMGIKPTKPERRLQQILDRYFPYQYKYTGDGKLIINGMRPDFANCNGKKDVIEVFGNFWHGPRKTKDNWRATELGKMMAYGSLGYRCLVIWERELNSLPEDEIVNKIKAFVGVKK